MRQLPSRLRRLDGALANLPLEEPMLLSELDGYLTGVLLCPDPVPFDEWMQPVWGSDLDGVPPFEDPLDVQWFADAVTARRAEIARDLARGRLQPLFDVDERFGEVLWEPWLDAFGEAMALRPDAAWADSDDLAAGAALARLSLLIAVARDESALDSVQINDLQDGAAGEIVAAVQCLFAARPRTGADDGVLRPKPPGRNDPCACGSGKKSKRCCG